MKKKFLIVNADGFGFTRGINRGIVDSIERGIVRSTSALVNMPAIDEVDDFQKRFPKVSIGIHFNLSVGKPISDPKDVPTLINKKAEFLREKFVVKLVTGQIQFSEIVLELENQVKRIVEIGVRPTHFDGHQNKHLYPQFFLAALNVARKWDIPFMRTHRRHLFVKGEKRLIKLCRYYISQPKRIVTHSFTRMLTFYAHMKGIKTADRLISPGYAYNNKKSSLETWIDIIKNFPQGINEIYCHPGYPDELLSQYASYVEERKVEVEVLTNQELLYEIERSGVQLISFKELL